MSNLEKRRDIIDLIRLSSMQPEQLDPTLPMLVEHALIANGTKRDPAEILGVLKRRILSDEFIEKFLQPFEEIFSHEEVRQLIAVYKSEAMRKFSKNGQRLFNPIYDAYRYIVQEAIGK
jgi:hypothetical protein